MTQREEKKKNLFFFLFFLIWLPSMSCGTIAVLQKKPTKSVDRFIQT